MQYIKDILASVQLVFLGCFFLFSEQFGEEQVTLESEIKITDLAMYFEGNILALGTMTNNPNSYEKE